MNAHEYADQVALEGGYPCMHGHINCAVRKGGPCQDELLTQHEAAGGCENCSCGGCGHCARCGFFDAPEEREETRSEGPPPYDAATATGMYDPEGS